MSVFDTVIQYYSADIKAVRPLGTLTLLRLLQSIQKPSERVQATMMRIRTTTDSAEKSELKKQLYAFTPAVMVRDRRCYSEITSFTRLMPIDYDGLDPQDAVQLKHYLFHSCTSIVAAWLSPSGRGVRALVLIDKVATVDQYKALFNGFARSEFGGFVGFDSSCQNSVLPMFLSYDPDIIVADPLDVVSWTTRYVAPPPQIQNAYKVESIKTGSIERIIAGKVNAITTNGHPQLRAAAFTLGGYVGSGLIDYNNALSLINRLIESNQYLSTKHRTADVYKKTAKQMIDKGILSPIALSHNN